MILFQDIISGVFMLRKFPIDYLCNMFLVAFLTYYMETSGGMLYFYSKMPNSHFEMMSEISGVEPIKCLWGTQEPRFPFVQGIECKEFASPSQLIVHTCYEIHSCSRSTNQT